MPDRITVPLDTDLDGRSAQGREATRLQRLARLQQIAVRIRTPTPTPPADGQRLTPSSAIRTISQWPPVQFAKGLGQQVFRGGLGTEWVITPERVAPGAIVTEFEQPRQPTSFAQSLGLLAGSFIRPPAMTAEELRQSGALGIPLAFPPAGVVGRLGALPGELRTAATLPASIARRATATGLAKVGQPGAALRVMSKPQVAGAASARPKARVAAGQAKMRIGVAKEPWQMTPIERQSEIARLKATNRAAWATEGDLGPNQQARMSARQHDKYMKQVQQRLDLERQIEALNRNDAEWQRIFAAKEERATNSRILQLTNQIEDLQRVGVGAGDKIKPSYQREIDKARAELTVLSEGKPAPPSVLADYPDLAKPVVPKAVAPVSARGRVTEPVTARAAAPGIPPPVAAPKAAPSTLSASVQAQLRDVKPEARETQILAIQRGLQSPGQKIAMIKFLEDLGTAPSPKPSVKRVIPKETPEEVTERMLSPLATVYARREAKQAAVAQAAPLPPPVQRPSVAPAGAPPVRPPIRPTAVGAPGSEEFAGNIRLSKYSEEARDILKEWADANPDVVQSARRGIRSDAQILEDAKWLDTQRLAGRWKPGTAYNAEEITALRGALNKESLAIAEAKRAITAGVDTAANKLRLQEAFYKRAQLQESVHGVSSETGRALRAHRLAASEALQSGDVQKINAILKELENRVSTEKLLTAIEHVDLDNPAQVASLIRAFTKPKLWEYGLEVVINGYLSGPTSHEINSLSNAAMVSISPARRGIAATVEAVVAPLQGRTRQRFFAEVPADIMGAIQGIPEGARAFLYTMRKGAAPSVAAKYELPRIQAFKGPLGHIVNLPSRLMEAADQLFYHINYRAAMNAEAIRMARLNPKGLSSIERMAEILTNPTAEMMGKARNTAERNLFRDDPGSFINGLMALRSIELLGLPLGRFLFPFVRTPSNLLRQGLRHSPAGLANPKMWQSLIARDPEFADRVAEVILGTGIASALALYFAKGNITGPAPTNTAARDAFYRSGKLPFAIKIGNTWVQYRRLEPFNTALTEIAAVMQAIDEGDETNAAEKAGTIVSSIGRNFLDQPYMSGIASVIEAIEDPDGFGATFLERFAAGIIPYSSAQRQTAAMLEPTYRQPKGLRERMMVQTPGLAERVPARLTAFGEEARRTSPAGFPIAWSEAQEGAVEAELTRLGINIGFVGKTIGGKELTREQQQEYQRRAGQAVYDALVRLISSSAYHQYNDFTKERAINRAVNSIRERVRQQTSRAVVSPTEVTLGQEAPPTYLPGPAAPAGSAAQTRLQRLQAIAERLKQQPVGATP